MGRPCVVQLTLPNLQLALPNLLPHHLLLLLSPIFLQAKLLPLKLLKIKLVLCGTVWVSCQIDCTAVELSNCLDALPRLEVESTQVATSMQRLWQQLRSHLCMQLLMPSSRRQHIIAHKSPIIDDVLLLANLQCGDELAP